MDKRNITDKQRSWLEQEMGVWRNKSILSPEQPKQILDLYETVGATAERRTSRGIFALMGIAVFLIGLAVLLLIGYNWQGISRNLKLLIILGVTAATYAGGFHLRYKRNARKLSEVVFLMGCLFYGAGIWLIAQIFHLNAHYPNGVWWWAVGVLPLALCMDTMLLHVLLAGLLATWAGMEIIGFSGMSSWWRHVPNGAYTLPLMAVPGLAWAYRKQSPGTVGLYALVIAWWVILQSFAWNWETNPIYFVGSFGALFLIIAESHKSGSPFSIPYRFYGTIIVGVVLAILSFYEANEEFLDHRETYDAMLATVFIVSITALVFVTATFAWRRHARSQEKSAVAVIGDVMKREWLPIILAMLMAFLSFWHALANQMTGNTAIVPTVLANIAMVACAFWLMSAGLREDRGRPFAAGVCYFLLWAIMRYADLFGDMGGMLGASLMFFLCGATLFGVALYWRRRKGVQSA